MIFDRLHKWHEAWLEERRWTQYVYEELKKYIGAEKASEIFKYNSREDKIRFIKNLRDTIKDSDIIPDFDNPLEK